MSPDVLRTALKVGLALLFLVPLLAPVAAAQAAAPETYQIEVYLHEASFGLHLVPEQIIAPVGVTLDVTVTNQGASPHNLMFCGDPQDEDERCEDKWAFTPNIGANQTAKLLVTLPRAGTFDFYCYILGHKGAGMRGTLIVEGDEPGGAKTPLGLLAPAALVLTALLLRRRSP